MSSDADDVLSDWEGSPDAARQPADSPRFGLVVRWVVAAPGDVPTVLGRVADAVRAALMASGVTPDALDHDLWLCTDMARDDLDAFIRNGYGA